MGKFGGRFFQIMWENWLDLDVLILKHLNLFNKKENPTTF